MIFDNGADLFNLFISEHDTRLAAVQHGWARMHTKLDSFRLRLTQKGIQGTDMDKFEELRANIRVCMHQHFHDTRACELVNRQVRALVVQLHSTQLYIAGLQARLDEIKDEIIPLRRQLCLYRARLEQYRAVEQEQA